MDFGIASVAGITVIAYLCGLGAKNIPAIDNKWIPTICGIIGGILGVVGLYTMPDFPVSDIVSAIAVGVVSGLSATGIHQVGKQLIATKTPEGSDE